MSEILSLVSIIVAIIIGLGAICTAIYVYRKQSPRREFSYEVTASPLVSTEVQDLDKLSVYYDGSPMSRPYLVTVQMGSTGRADISSKHFDANKPILVKLNVPILREIEQTTNLETVDTRLQFTEGQSFIELPPSLLPKGYLIRASYLCNGVPKVEHRIALPDLAIREGFRSAAGPMGIPFKFAVILAIVALISAAWNSYASLRTLSSLLEQMGSR